MWDLQGSQMATLCWLAVKGLLVNPLLYIGVVLMIWDIRRTAGLERQFFGFRVSRPWRRLFRLWLASIISGIVISVIGMMVGISVQPWQVWTVTAICILGGIIRLRFAAGLFGIAGLLVMGLLASHFGPTNLGSGVVGHWLAAMRAVNPANWLSLGCLLALAEGILLYIERDAASPVLKRSRRGRPIGAFSIQSTFLMPIFVLAPGMMHIQSHTPWPWPLWASVLSSVSAIGFPVLAGYSGVHAVTEGTRVVRRQAATLLWTGVLLAADAWVCYRFGTIYALIGFVLILAAREWPLITARRQEATGDPKYVPSSAGVKVLAVAPGSVAESMGLRAGEVIRQVNQVPVHTAYDLHFAFDQNPAYAKLEVLDVRGELRLTGKPVYSGERHRLGLVLLPDRATVRSFDRHAIGLMQTLYPRLSQPSAGPEEPWMDAETRTF